MKISTFIHKIFSIPKSDFLGPILLNGKINEPLETVAIDVWATSWWNSIHSGFVVVSQCPIVSFKSYLKNKGLKSDLMYLNNWDFGWHYLVPGKLDLLLDCMTSRGFLWIWTILTWVLFEVLYVIESFGLVDFVYRTWKKIGITAR